MADDLTQPRVRGASSVELRRAATLAATLAAVAVLVVAAVLALGSGLHGAHHASAQATTTPTAPTTQSAQSAIVAVLRAIAIVLALTAALGWVAVRLGQPRVIGEILAGIALGPTLLGAIDPGLATRLFGGNVHDVLTGLAQLALALFAFQLGLEMDLAGLRRRTPRVLAITSASVLVPLVAGVLCGLATFAWVGPSAPFAGYATFVGAAMSITALPVLARILADRGLTRSSIGLTAMSCAAVGDLFGWLLVALATALTHGASPLEAARTLGLALALGLALVLVARPALARLAAPTRPPGMAFTVAVVALAVAASTASEAIGVSVIFGGLIAGACMPRRTTLSELVLRDVQSYSVLLLPLFFAVTGISTDIRLLGTPDLIALTIGLTLVAAAAKGGSTLFAARWMRLGWRESAGIGTLMNTRGLTELAVLSVGLSAGALSPEVYAALVVMALVTTLATGPLLRLLRYDHRTESDPADEDLTASRQQLTDRVGGSHIA